MEESFSNWRNTSNKESDSDLISEDDSDIVEDSKSSDKFFAPDSDEEFVIPNRFLQTSGSKSIPGSVIPASDEEEEEEIANLSTLPSQSTNESRDSIASHSSSASLEGENLVKKPQKNLFLDNDEEKERSILSTTQSTNKSHASLASQSSSASLGEEIVVKKSQKKYLIVDSDEEDDNDQDFLSLSDNVYSSTKLVNNTFSMPDSPKSKISINQSSSSSDSEKSNGEGPKFIDLTSLSRSVAKMTHASKKRNVIEESEDDKHSTILIEDEDTPKRKTSQGFRSSNTSSKGRVSLIDLTTMECSPQTTSDHSKESDSLGKDSSRLESLKLEEQRLKMNVSDVTKSIENAKTTLRSADVATLPDRGVQLQIHIKRQEMKLRDLRYQQGTLANEILKLQIASKNSQQPISSYSKASQPMNSYQLKLPTSQTDINAMGKKAMETHRVQQALTVDALRQLHDSLKNCPSENTFETDPAGLLVELMPHQRHGLAWLMWRERSKPSGGILADDMGLGKTLTMLSLILKSEQSRADEDGEDSDSVEDDGEWMRSNRNRVIEGNTLIVCPATLLGQWEGEIKNKMKRNKLSYVVHHGSQREKKARRLADYSVVITTYNIISRDASAQSQSPLMAIRWRRVILDEAHQVRNPKTQMAKGVYELKAKSRWALTGTPVHNKELDLYSLIKFLRCKPFDDLMVWKRWVDNKDAAGLQRLNSIMKSLMLRRTKQGLQEKGELRSLTEKSFYNISVAMDEEEKKGYEKLLVFSKTLFSQFLHQKAEKENVFNGYPIFNKRNQNKNDSSENPFADHPELARLHNKMSQISDIKSHHILVLILRLRQFCCLPALIKTMLENEEVKAGGIEDNEGLDIDMMDKLTRMSLKLEPLQEDEEIDEEEAGLSLKNPLFAEDRLSSKLRAVFSKLEEILESDDKVIVVSQFVSLLNVFYLHLKGKGVKCAMLTGSVPIPDRAIIVDKFNRPDRGPRVLMLSLTAGGVGLNLVGANHLLMVDLHWNPQLESQAFDRIYRVGQTKNVHIYKFVQAGSIEERILALQEKKLTIADNVLTGAKNQSKLTLDDLKTLFNVT